MVTGGRPAAARLPGRGRDRLGHAFGLQPHRHQVAPWDRRRCEGVSSSGPLESSDTEHRRAPGAPAWGGATATTRRLVAPLWIQTAVALPALSTMTAG
jgi:hypothetical protein